MDNLLSYDQFFYFFLNVHFILNIFSLYNRVNLLDMLHDLWCWAMIKGFNRLSQINFFDVSHIVLTLGKVLALFKISLKQTIYSDNFIRKLVFSIIDWFEKDLVVNFIVDLLCFFRTVSFFLYPFANCQKSGYLDKIIHLIVDEIVLDHELFVVGKKILLLC